MNPGYLWWLSTRLHRRGFRAASRVLSFIIYVLFKADLPPECSVARDVTLFHRALGVVVNPDVSIGEDVRIVHGVTIGVVTAAGQQKGRVVIEDGVRIGAGATILASPGKVLIVGSGARIGARAYVRHSVPAGAKVLAPLSQIVVD